MSIRRQKNIASTRDELLNALDAREVLLLKLVRLEMKIIKLKKRIGRAEKAKIGKHDPASPVSMVGETLPFRYERVEVTDDLDDPIPL